LRIVRTAAVLFLLAALLPLTASTTTAQQRPLTVKTNYPFVVSEAGRSVKFDIRVLTSQPRPVRLEMVQAPPGWQFELRGGGFLIGAVFGDPEEPPQAELEVRVPPETPQGDYQLVLQGTAPGAVDRLTLTVRISDQAPGAVTLTSDFPAQRGTPTDTFTFRLTLENNTPEETSFTLAAQGPEGWDVQARPTAETRAASITVEGGGTTDVEVSVDPPDQAPAETYPIKVTATGPGGQQASTEVTVEITGTRTLAFTTSDERLNREGVAGRTREVTLVVRNEGTAPLQNVRLSDTSPTGWRVQFEPEVVEAVPPGETREVVARVTPAGDAVAGDYNITLTASGAQGGSESLELRYTVRASRLWGLIGLLLIVAVLFGMRYVFQRYGRR